MKRAKGKIFILFASIIVLLVSCASHGGRGAAENTLPRAHPAFMQWLARQSLHAQAEEMVRQVSQSSRLWLNSGPGHSPEILLKVSPSWLEVNAHASPGHQSLFRILAASAENVANFGFEGIFLGPTGELPEMWVGKEPSGLAARDRKNSHGHNFASLKFDSAAGTEDDFDMLAARAQKAHLQLGSDLLGAATGIGPDFLLASRKMTDYGGLYAMLPIPGEHEDLLPSATSENDFQELDEANVQSLAEKGALPASLSRDKLEWASKAGWAVTGPVRGVDGKNRRWAYRYSGNAMRPVMLWHDPSGAARKIVSGSIISSTGFNQESLVGIRLESLIGLEAAPQKDGGMKELLLPALEAMNSVALEVHRYGGWAIQADPLPPQAMQAVLEGSCDFCRDAVTPALVAYALLKKDAVPLASLHAAWLKDNVDQSRMGRGLNDFEGIQWQILKGMPKEHEIAIGSLAMSQLPPLKQLAPHSGKEKTSTKKAAAPTTKKGPAKQKKSQKALINKVNTQKLAVESGPKDGTQPPVLAKAAPKATVAENLTEQPEKLLAAADAKLASPMAGAELLQSPSAPHTLLPRPRSIPHDNLPAPLPENVAPQSGKAKISSDGALMEQGPQKERAEPAKATGEVEGGIDARQKTASENLPKGQESAISAEQNAEVETSAETPVETPAKTSGVQNAEKNAEPEKPAESPVETAADQKNEYAFGGGHGEKEGEEAAPEEIKSEADEEPQVLPNKSNSQEVLEKLREQHKEEMEEMFPTGIPLVITPGTSSEPVQLEDIYNRLFAGRKGGGYEAFYNLFFAWRIGLPGLAFISAAEMESLGENFAGSVLWKGVSHGNKKVFLPRLRKLLEVRHKCDLANGRVVAVSSGKNSTCGVLSRLPGNGYWLVASNFGDSRAVVELALPEKVRRARDAATGASLDGCLGAGGNRLRMSLDGYQSTHILLQK